MTFPTSSIYFSALGKTDFKVNVPVFDPMFQQISPDKCVFVPKQTIEQSTPIPKENLTPGHYIEAYDIRGDWYSDTGRKTLENGTYTVGFKADGLFPLADPLPEAMKKHFKRFFQ